MAIRVLTSSVCLAAGFLLADFSLFAQPTINLSRLSTVPLHYTCPKVPAGKYIVLDGQITENEWSTAPWTSDFLDIEGIELPKPRYRTRARMLWDEEALYVAAELEEPHLWATLRNRDDIIFRDNDFEVFLSGDVSDREYYEFEVNAFNTLFDLLLPMAYRDGGKADIPWNAPGFKSAVNLNGTLNQPDDGDKGWSVEMRIPFKDLAKSGKGLSPSEGSIWRINFSRVEYDVVVKSGKYEKLKDDKGKDRPEYNWVWSPQGIIDMHFPERWGYLIFQENEMVQNQSEHIENAYEKTLWMVYYAQRQQFRETENYFEKLPNKVAKQISDIIPDKALLNIKRKPKGWKAALSGPQVIYLIDNKGRLKIKKQ